MKLLGRSLAEDTVDGYNRTWSVLFMLLLALVTWLSALSPDVRSSLNPHGPESHSPYPQYRATCWCPAQFERAHVDYTNAVCALTYNHMVRGEVKTSPARLYEMVPENIPPYRDVGGIERNGTSLGDEDIDQDDNTKRVHENLSRFVFFKTPVLLFIFAVLLKLPHVVWILLSSCCSLNVDSTLETAVHGQTLDQDSRKKLNKELTWAVSEDVRQTKMSATVLYILMKTLALFVAVGELVYTCDYLDEASALKKDVPYVSRSTGFEKNFGGRPLHCEYSIRQIHNVHEYTVQCLFEKMSSTDASVLEMYEVLFTTVAVYLIVLVIVNTLNLVSWLARLLVGPCRVSLGSGSELLLDGQLLLHMARLNAGPLVTRSMMDGMLGGVGGKEDKTELEMLQE